MRGEGREGRRVIRNWSGRASSAWLLGLLVLMVAPGALAARGGDGPADAPSGDTVGIAAVGETKVLFDQQGNRVLRVDDGYDLDQYLFRSSSPLDFSIFIDGDFGPVESDGSPAPGNDLYGKDVRITLRVWDVDDDYEGTDVEPEQDQLVVNGTVLPGFLSGANNQWSINTFVFSSDLLKLPTSADPSIQNDFQVLIDTANEGADVWAVEVDWAELRLFDAAERPVVMVHGFNGSPDSMTPFQEFFEKEHPPLIDRIIRPAVGPRDGTEANAQALVQPVEDFLAETNSATVDFVVHSKGGLDTRRFIWDNSGVVANLIMLGSPNRGSELADFVCDYQDAPDFGIITAIKALLEFKAGDCDDTSGAVYQLQTDYVRDTFNRQVPDRVGTSYWTMAGTDGGFLSFMLPGEDDGVVAVESVEWLRAHDVDNPMPPGLHVPLGRYDLDHSGLVSTVDSPTMADSLCLLRPSTCESAGGGGGAFALMEAGSVVPTGDITDITLQPGEEVTVDLDLEGSATAVVMLIVDDVTNITADLDGQALTVQDLLGADVLGVLADPAGEGLLRVTNNGTVSVDGAAVAAVESARVLSVSTSTSLAAPGSSVDITVEVTEGDSGDQPHLIVADGTGAVVVETDPASTGTGAWTTTLDPLPGGTYTATALLEGDRRRLASVIFTVGSGAAQLTGSFTEGTVDDDGDGLYDALIVSPQVDVAAAGRYQVALTLADAAGNLLVAAGGGTDLATGTQTIPVRVEGDDLFASRTSGPYEVVDVLLSRDISGVLVMEQEVATLGSTAAYDFRSFQHFPIHFDLDGFADSPQDTNGDGEFDELVVTGGVWVDTTDTYLINARLLAPDGSELAEFQNSASFAAGDNSFQLTFPWSAIANSGQNGPYIVADLSVYPSSSAEVLGYLVVAHYTAPYEVAPSGAAQAWGGNSQGQLGNGTTTDSSTPVDVADLVGVAIIGAGGEHSLAALSDGTAWAWGQNANGQLGDGTLDDRTTPVQVSGLSGITQVDGGLAHSLALRNDGTVWAWGLNRNGQLGDGTTTQRTTPVQVSGLTDVIAIAAGGDHSLALKSDGTVWAWGKNSDGQLGDGSKRKSSTPVQVSGLTDVVAIAGGGAHSLAVKSDGTVWAWGDNFYGQLGDGTTRDRNTPVQVADLTGAETVDGGSFHSLAVKSDGTVWAWGRNVFGQLGDGTTTDRTTPVQTSNLTTAASVSAGAHHSLAALSDGTAWTWGYNGFGQLGDGTTTNSSLPVQATGAEGVADVAAGAWHSLTGRQ